MRDVELYQQLLGLVAPWTVGRVELSVEGERVDIWAEHAEVRWPCPECETLLPVYDHSEEREWRHLDSCQFKTFLHARAPRIACPTHGTRQVKLPWAEPRSRFTLLFERLAIDVLQEATVRGATRILRISWDEAWHLIERAVKRGLQAKDKAFLRVLVWMRKRSPREPATSPWCATWMPPPSNTWPRRAAWRVWMATS